MKNSQDLIQKVADKHGISFASARTIIESAFYFVPRAARESDRATNRFYHARVPFFGSFTVKKRERIIRGVENLTWDKTKKPHAYVGMKVDVFAVAITPEGNDYIYKGVGTVMAVGGIYLRRKRIVEKGVRSVIIDETGEAFSGKYIDWYPVQTKEEHGFIDTEITQSNTIALPVTD